MSEFELEHFDQLLGIRIGEALAFLEFALLHI